MSYFVLSTLFFLFGFFSFPRRCSHDERGALGSGLGLDFLCSGVLEGKGREGILKFFLGFCGEGE